MSPALPFPSGMRGQGATEYVVLLGIVLTLGLAILAVVNFFPAFTYNSQSGDSLKYWANSASPISIVDYTQSGTALQFVAENRAPTGITLDSIVLEADSNYTVSSLPLTLAPGERRSLAATTESCSAHQAISYGVYISYSTEQVSNLSQVGIKPLFVQCSS